MSKTQVLKVKFNSGAVVDLGEAWAYSEAHRDDRPTMAIAATPTGAEFLTFAKGFYAWHFGRRVWLLARIGIGAYGDHGPENPALIGARFEQRLEGGAWAYGIAD